MIHETADVDSEAVIGDRVKVWRWTHISKGVVLSNDVSVGQGCYIGPNVFIGQGTRIQNNAFIPEGVTIQSKVFIGPHVVFTNDLHPKIGHPWEIVPTLVGPFASIGANATILCGTIIGAKAMIGAGSVIVRSVKPGQTVCGIYSG